MTTTLSVFRELWVLGLHTAVRVTNPQPLLELQTRNPVIYYLGNGAPAGLTVLFELGAETCRGPVPKLYLEEQGTC